MKLRTVDWLVIVALLILAVIPDPSDILDFGLPILEPLMIVVYYYWRKGKER